MIEITPKQASAIHAHYPGTCTTIRVERSSPTSTVRAVDVSYFDRARFIFAVRIQPGGAVKDIA